MLPCFVIRRHRPNFLPSVQKCTHHSASQTEHETNRITCVSPLFTKLKMSPLWLSKAPKHRTTLTILPRQGMGRNVAVCSPIGAGAVGVRRQMVSDAVAGVAWRSVLAVASVVVAVFEIAWYAQEVSTVASIGELLQTSTDAGHRWILHG